VRIPPLSLHARLALVALAMVFAAVVVMTYELVNVVTWSVTDKLDVALDDQIRILDRAVDARGAFAAERVDFVPALSRPGPGWSWQVTTPLGVWSRAFPVGKVIYPQPRIHPVDGIFSGYGTALSGESLHVRRFETRRGAGPVTITVIAPADLVDHPLATVSQAIRRAQIVIAVVLVASLLLQLHFGLRPLRKLVRAVARVRNAEAQALPGHQPSELEPLAREINALIARNNAGLEAARLNAANLAHALKTPLATLMLQLELDHASAESRALVTRISDQVAHHLRRARSGAIGLGTRARADAHQVAEAIRPVLVSLMRGRAIRLGNLLPDPCMVGVEAQDLGEMLGNLLENACRHARGEVEIWARIEADAVVIGVDDDGSGVAPEQLARIAEPGVRLDEMGEGYGLGLAIVREQAMLYDGTLTFRPAPRLGGLRTELRLPR
jgi:signal transduction histidine kinase